MTNKFALCLLSLILFMNSCVSKTPNLISCDYESLYKYVQEDANRTKQQPETTQFLPLDSILTSRVGDTIIICSNLSTVRFTGVISNEKFCYKLFCNSERITIVSHTTVTQMEIPDK